MTYEVRKDGRTYMGTEHESCRYPPEIEASGREMIRSGSIII